MKAALLGVAALVATAVAAAPAGTRTHAVSCASQHVRRDSKPELGPLTSAQWVQVDNTPMFGILFGGEVVNGGFAVYARGYNAKRKIRERVLWVVPESQRQRAGATLAITARLGTTVKHWRVAASSGDANETPGVLFSWFANLPTRGCWTLSLATGQIKGSLRVLALPAPQR